VEESVLIEYCIRGFKAGFLMIIWHFNVCANELLWTRDFNETVDYYWYNSFFKCYSEVKFKFSRLINRRRLNAEDFDEFIKFFRRFINVKNKWGIVDSDIYNIDKSRSAIGIKQSLKFILFSEKKQAFAK